MNIRCEICEADTPNKNGTIIPAEILQKTVNEYNNLVNSKTEIQPRFRATFDVNENGYSVVQSNLNIISFDIILK